MVLGIKSKRGSCSSVPRKSFDTVLEEDQALAQKVFVTVPGAFLPSIGMPACLCCGKNDNVSASFDCWMCFIRLWSMHDLHVANVVVYSIYGSCAVAL